MELADGVTLAERIAKSPMSLEAALSIAKQIAGALQYAHGKGMIHREGAAGSFFANYHMTYSYLQLGRKDLAEAADLPRELTFGCDVGADRDRHDHQHVVGLQVEQLAAIASPARLRAACGRQANLPAASWKSLCVDLRLARFVGGAGDPVAD
jgi:hypothetical protein